MMVHQPESAATLVALQSVSQCYPGRQGMVKVLDEVSLSVCQGDFIAITGESGSGKSTLLNIIGLLMPPSSGVVNYQGRPVSFGRGAEVAQRAAGRPIGFVFQQFNLIPSLSVLDNVALPLLYQGLAPAARAAQSLAVLETLGIADKAGQRPDDLSGGQKQDEFRENIMTTSVSSSLATTSIATLTATVATSSSQTASQSRGHALMLERLWRIKDPSTPEPKILYTVTTDMLSGNSFDFLTYSDRRLLEKVYSYAEENNIDLEQVDLLAFDMAGYRMAGPGGYLPNKPGNSYTPDGKWIINAFDERDTKLAYQIQNGKAMLSTEFDRGFLNEELDPEKMPTHGVDFAFLAKMVKQFSDQAGQPDENIQMPDDPNRRYADPGHGSYLVETLNGKKPPTHPDNLAKGGDDSTNVLTYLTKQDRKKLLAAYQLLMSLGMSTEQLDQTATRLGATRMREATGVVAPVNTSASAGDKATRAYSSQNTVTSLLDSLHPANRQKTRQPHMSKVLETLLIAERAEAAQR